MREVPEGGKRWGGWPAMGLLLAGLALRLVWIGRHPAPTGDPLVYGAIARNWLLHGVYGYAETAGHPVPTLIRLPGYPLFLLACFKVFGVGHWLPVLWVQALFDVHTAVLLGGAACRLWSRRAGLWALGLAATCPFLANYAANPLTETLELWATALAIFVCAQLLAPGQSVARQARPVWAWRPVLLLAVAWGYAALLRPDGALLAVALCPALVLGTRGRALKLAMAAGVLAVLPFVPWAARNWHTFHVFEPLAPRYATDPGEPTHPGFQAWTRTVCADFACTQEVYWNLDSDDLDIHALPARAFDSPAQYAETKRVLDAYNRTDTLTPAGDAAFAGLAAERRRAHPVRSAVGMPTLRLLDMFLRPRLELTPNDLRWWQWGEHPGETAFGYGYAALNLGYFALALWGAARRPPLLGAMLAFALLRSALLGTIEAPEQRYTLEFLPFAFVLAGVALGGKRRACGF